jgi:hypothetical protein
MRAITVIGTICATLALGACANDTLVGGLAPQPTTAALPPKPAVDPACATLAARIDGLRKDGVVERVEAAAKGKGSTVKVKRDSLAQIAELEKANLEFQAKCSTVPRAAAVPAAKTAAAASPAKTAAAGPASDEAKAEALMAKATAESARTASTAKTKASAAVAAKAQ